MGRTIRICSAPARPASARRRSTTRFSRGALALGLTLLPAPALADTSGLAAYLRARVAGERHDGATAVSAYGRALEASPDPVVAIRAFRGALAAGDLQLARKAAAVLDRAGAATDDMLLLPLADAAAGRQAAAFDVAVDRVAGSKLAMLAPALRGWAAWSRKADWAAPLDRASDPVARRLAEETRALLLIADGREKEGATALRAAGDWSESGIARSAATELLVRAGDRELAASLLPPESRARLARVSRGDGARASLAWGTSTLFTRLASELLLGDSAPLGVSLLRAALVADPRNDMARLLISAALKDMRATDAALAALDGVRRDALLAADAAVARVQILSAADRSAEALALARRLAERRDAERNDWQIYADLLSGANRPAEAVPFYRRIAHGDGAGEWDVWMQLGGALELAGDWPAARDALAKAVELAPDEPLALNYLGYARVTRGEAKQASTRLLERAHQLAPDNASIIESLGWAYHLTGDTRRALPLLERAAEGEPGNAEIAEHLGDAYWALGRRYEARYAWVAAAMVAEAKDKARLSAKASDGL